MKRIILAVALALLSALCAFGQSYNIKVDASIPEQARQLLLQRFTQMLEAGGLAVAGDGAPLEVKVAKEERTQMQGGQVALSIELMAAAGDVKESFPLKNIGENEADAWLRAAKQLLPRSKAAQAFVTALK